MRWRISCKLAKKNHLALRHFIRYSFLELLDSLLELRLESIIQLLLVDDLLGNFRMLCVHELQEVRLELNDFLDRNINEIALDSRVDDHDLILNEQRAVLSLFQRLNHAGTAVELCLRLFIEVRSELRERCELAVLSKVESHRTSDLFHGFNLCGTADTRYGKTDVDSRADAGIVQSISRQENF